jgi:hypothetical protein
VSISRGEIDAGMAYGPTEKVIGSWKLWTAGTNILNSRLIKQKNNIQYA